MGKRRRRNAGAIRESKILCHPAWPTHRCCEVEPDLDSTSLSLLVANARASLPYALARSWAIRLMANYDGGLKDLEASRWDLTPGKSRSWQGIFKKAQLDNAVPRMRLQQWSAYCHQHKLRFSGQNMQSLAAEAFGRLTKAGAWEKAARAGVNNDTLKRILDVHNPFLRKLVLHDMWLSHRVGEESRLRPN